MVKPPITVNTKGLCKSAPIPLEKTTGSNAKMVVIEVIKIGLRRIIPVSAIAFSRILFLVFGAQCLVFRTCNLDFVICFSHFDFHFSS
jgi:hypothetical protein